MPPLSLLGRAPVVLAALLVVWRPIGWRRWLLLPLLLAGLAQDALLPAVASEAALARRISERVAEVAARLGRFAEDPEVRRLLAGGGGEAEPLLPFELLDDLARDLDGVAALVLIDERGAPVGWHGARASLPVRLRPLGERVVTSEVDVDGLSVWWREPVFETGRPVGAVLARARLPASGDRSPLGVSAGRAAVATPDARGENVRGGTGAPLLGVGVRRAAPRLWSAAGSAVILVALVLLPAGAGPRRLLLLLIAGGGALLVPVLGLEWKAAAALFIASQAVVLLPARLWTRLVAAAALGGLVPVLIALVRDRGLEPVPETLLWPGLGGWALLLAGALAVRGAVRGAGRPPWPLMALAWLPLVAGVVLANPWLLAVGLGVVIAAGIAPRSTALAALAAAMAMVGAADVARRQGIAAGADQALAAAAGLEARAVALLAAVPEHALDALVASTPGERQVALGRIAVSLGLEHNGPGATLVVRDGRGTPAATWGEATTLARGGGRELASRAFASSWSLVLGVPPPPHDLLGALADRGLGGPLAAFDRFGVPTGRGGVFRPLPLDRVAQAVSRVRDWQVLGVGERELLAYLAVRGEWVMAVAWGRRTLAESALVIAALALWGALPVAAAEQRDRLAAWWKRRHTFAGRVQALSVATAILPVLLLAQLLPQQWNRQRERERLEFGRAVSRPILAAGWDRDLPWVVRDMGGIVAVYRDGALLTTTRPDVAALGRLPALPPRAAFARAVTGWREPLVASDDRTDVYAPVSVDQQPFVIALLGLPAPGFDAPSPREWFAVMGVLASILALAAADRLGRRLTGPLERLTRAVSRLERGERVAPLEVAGDEDVAALSRSFVAMAGTVQRREEELRAERDLLGRVLGALSAAVVVADARGGILLANPAATTLVAAGRGVDALSQRLGPAIDELLAQAVAGEAAERSVQPPGLPDALWRITTQPLATGGQVLLVMEDLSEVARAQRLASLAQAARIVAHEVKNPLTPIRLWAEELQAALERGPAATVEVATAAAAQILDRVEHLREVAQGFSNLASIDRWTPEPVRPARVASDALAEYRVLEQRGIEVTLTVESEAEVEIDPTWLRRAVRHLLANSARALAGKPGRLGVWIGQVDGELHLVVQDTGGGVPDEHLGRLFEPHFSTTSEGSGLGLAVVQRVVTQAGGRVSARNRGGGLEVRIVLPIAGAAAC